MILPRRTKNQTIKPRSLRGFFSARRFAGANPAFPARLKRRWLAGTGGGHLEKVENINAQGFGNPFDNIQRGVEIAAFKAADGRAVNVGINRKILLGDLPSGSQHTKVPGNAGAYFHTRIATILWLFYPSDISNIFIRSKPRTVSAARCPAIQPTTQKEAS
ncbi:hypothetical protein [Neorhizobium alkalisoli]